MKLTRRRSLLALATFFVISALVLIGGLIPVSASSGHWWITEQILQFAKRRSIATWSRKEAPQIDHAELVVAAGHYDLACAPCHGSPAARRPATAMSMLPVPPKLRDRVARYDAGELFTIVQGGIKFTGMPAWPTRWRPDEVWAMVAFLQKLQHLDARAYRALTAPGSQVEMHDGRVAPRSNAFLENILASCRMCHGVDGLGRGGLDLVPWLAGQRREYLRNSLMAYAARSRASGVMQAVASRLTVDQIDAIATHYSSLESPLRSAEVRAQPLLERGRAIAHNGIPARSIPACVDCHGPEAVTRDDYPRIGGLPRRYLERQLELFAAGVRGGSRWSQLMDEFAHALREADRRAVAAWYASLDAGGQR